MGSASKHELVNRNHLFRFRAMMIAMVAVYPAWYFIIMTALPLSKDSFEVRIALVVPWLAAFALSFASQLVQRHIETVYLVLALSIMAHVHWLADINQLTYAYVFGPFLAFLALSLAFDSQSHLMIFLIAGLSMSLFLSGEDAQITKTYFVSVMLTSAMASMLTTMMRLSYLRVIKHQQKTLDDTNQALHDALKTSKSLFVNTSHELRTPLTLIIGHTEALIENFSDQKLLQNPLSVIQRNAETLLAHVNNLLDLSRIESSGVQLALSRFDLIALLKAQQDSWKVFIERKNIEFTFAANVQTLPVVLDQDKTERIVMNLISNAIKFTPNGGRIRLSCNVDGPDVKIEVSDSGPGIPETENIRVFEPFVRLEDTAHNVGGTGLGLPIVREFTKIQSGSISISRSEWGGASFQLVLPVTLGEATATAAIRQDEAYAGAEPVDLTPRPSAPAPFVILFVEDNRDLLQFLESTFSHEFSVRLAENGEDALVVLNNEKIDLIISDITMPVLDGLGFFQKVRSNNSFANIPFVFLSARGDQDLKRSLFEAGAQDFVSKPFSISDVRQKILGHMHLRLANVNMLEEQNRALLREKDLVQELNEKLQLALSAANAASQAKTQFLANMSHELRTPLSSVSGFSEILLGTALNSDQQLYLERIRRSASTMLRLVDDLLVAARMDSDTFKIEKERFDSDELITDLQQYLQQLAQPKALAFNFTSHNIPTTIFSDKVRIKQVVTNLINNAVKFTPDGYVNVQASAEQKSEQTWTLKFSVEDSGIGIKQEDVERIFKPFEQVDSTNTRRFHGVGLGLHISLQITKALGGELTYTTPDSGQGSRFTATFIIQKNAPPAPINIPRSSEEVETLPSFKQVTEDS